MNKCVLIGNLTKDPEAGETSGGISFCKFTIAVNRRFKNADGETETDFLNIITWRGLAENCEKYLTKGSKVCVVGAIQTRTYEVDGQKRYATDILADEVEFLSTNRESGAEPKQAAQTRHKKPEMKPVGDEEGLPF